MKYLLTILFFLTAYFVNAQYIPNAGAYQYKGLKQTNSLQPPTGTAFPVTLTNAPDSNYAAWYYNKTDTSFYQFNPVPKTWTKLQSNGGIQVSIDSIFITSIDSIFISNTDSIFIVNGNDTIFIGTGNPAVDTIYQRGDSIFAVKSGIEFLAAVTGSSAPSGGMDTAYSRQDSIFGVKNNGEFLIATSQSGSSSIILDSFTVDFDGLHAVMSVPISAAAAKNIDISSESGSAGGFQFGWNSTEAVLTYQTAIKGTYKFYITYYQ